MFLAVLKKKLLWNLYTVLG